MFPRNDIHGQGEDAGSSGTGGHDGDFVAVGGPVTSEAQQCRVQRDAEGATRVHEHLRTQTFTVQGHAPPTIRQEGGLYDTSNFGEYLRHIYNTVIVGGTHNFRGARVRVPSGLCIDTYGIIRIGT